MPYISMEDMAFLSKNEPASPGHLNYLITMLCIDYLKARTLANGEYRYATVNEIVGVLECAKQEFYRRAVVRLEEAKIATNGDVYDF